MEEEVSVGEETGEVWRQKEVFWEFMLTDFLFSFRRQAGQVRVAPFNGMEKFTM